MTTRRRSAPSYCVESLETRTLLSTLDGTAAVTSSWDHVDPSRQKTRASQQLNIPYENINGRIERLNVYRPAGKPPVGGWPVIMAIHGGGWHKYSKDEYGPKIAAQFRPRGYEVVAMNYQLATPSNPSWPDSFDDVRAAVRWVRSNASALSIDPDRIAAIGESAGGNLAELLGTNPDGPAVAGGPAPSSGISAAVQAVISYYGPGDLRDLVDENALGAPAVIEYLGGSPRQVPASYTGASPIDHVSSSSAPMMLLHGTSDEVVPYVESRAMASALSAAGVRNQLFLVPGAQHGFEFDSQGTAFLPRIFAFLKSTLNG